MLNDPNVPKAATDIRNMGGRCGHNSAADNQILGVRFGEITADGYR
jgi:hypothetical protein